MSTIVMAACWPLQGMSPSQKAVLISLADQANDDGVCWPAISTIAQRTCLSERAVQEAIGWLQTVGLVFREYRFNTSTSYTVTPASYRPAAAPTKRERMRKGAPSAPGAAGAPPADSAPPALCAPGGADGAPGGADSAPHPPQVAHPGGADGAPKSSMNRKGNHQGTATEPFPPGEQAGPTAGGEADSGGETELQAACRLTWHAYTQAYLARYQVKPVRNAAVNANVKTLVKRLGHDEAPLVAAWYVEHVNEAFVVKNSHGVGILVNQAESFRTQWARGQAVTGAAAQAADKSSANLDAIEETKRLLRQRAARDAREGAHA
ncbi:hypothetical protein ABIC63_000527 [Pseudacidovorax sp. 1753]|uniref:helix-turn-helix domain-containing protein n=1 Tax=Pseudacidovorax sp. 1753 TaxID=3156419 RepID=UPI003390EC5B